MNIQLTTVDTNKHRSNIWWAKVLNRKNFTAFTCSPLEFSIPIRIFTFAKIFSNFLSQEDYHSLNHNRKKEEGKKDRSVVIPFSYISLTSTEIELEIELHSTDWMHHGNSFASAFLIIFRMRIIWIHGNPLNILLLSCTPFPVTLIHI